MGRLRDRGASWWQLVTAAYLAVVFTQIAFVGHDAGHRQIFRSRRGNDLVGLAHANLLLGVSFDWWVRSTSANAAGKFGQCSTYSTSTTRPGRWSSKRHGMPPFPRPWR